MKKFSKVIAFAICLVLIAGMLPAGVFAAEGVWLFKNDLLFVDDIFDVFSRFVFIH